MNARDEAVEMIRRICPAHLSADEYGQFLAGKFDAHRAEVLTEVTTSAYACPCRVLPEPGFFEPGREYHATEHATLRFRCLTVDTHPDTGERRAFGWRMNERTGLWRPSCLDPDDWACCDWTEVTEGGDAR
ncbi:hypothetical protein ACWET9_24845 [Streptomyces sp. NPDC004059]